MNNQETIKWLWQRNDLVISNVCFSVNFMKKTTESKGRQINRITVCFDTMNNALMCVCVCVSEQNKGS